MKKIYTLVTLIMLTVSVFAQSPEKMSYQAVIRDASNNLITNTMVGMQISILQTSTTGTAVYTETHTPITNDNGLVSIEIGTGTTTDNFSMINWANDTYFIKTETDPTGGTSYTITGTSQLLSVPYALHAKTADNITGGITETDPLYTASEAANITTSDISTLANTSGINTGDQDLSSYLLTEVDGSITNEIELPAGGTNGQVLKTDGNGNYTWVDQTTDVSPLVSNIYVSTWNTRTTAADNNWSSICWSPQLNLFVAVAHSGIGNRVMSSPDGINWTSRTSAADNGWSSVCWSQELNLFVAVASSGTGNRVMSSPDGINWTSQTTTGSFFWQSVCWSPQLNLFVAVGFTGIGANSVVMSSPDGINWINQASTPLSFWQSVCWSPQLNLFVAVGSAVIGASSNVITSPDGINWTNRASEISSWSSICWSPQLNLFVAVAFSSTGNNVITSPDGINWTSQASGIDNNWRSVTWSPEFNLFVAVSSSGTSNRVMTSSDGINWKTKVSAADNLWTSVCWSPQLSFFVAVSSSGTDNRVMTSLF